MTPRLAHGIDLVDCRRIARLLERHERYVVGRIFTPREYDEAPAGKRRIERLAGRFAAKEAIMKLIGTGWRDGVAWTDMEVSNDALGRPCVHLTGRVAELAANLGIDEITLSITHTADLAIASAVALVTVDERSL